MCITQPRAAIAAMVVGLSAVAASAETVQLFVFAGQSNLIGRNTRNTAQQLIDADPRYASPNTNVLYNFRLNENNRAGGGGGWGPLFHHEGFLNTTWGPDVVFGYELNARQPDLNFAIIKTAVGGTNLSQDWNPNAVSGRQLFADSMNFINNRIAVLEGQGKTVEIAGVFWVQGYDDLATAGQANDYGDNLAALAAAFRSEFADPNLPFILTREHIFTIPPGSNAPFGTVDSRVLSMRAGQEAFVMSDPNAYLIDIDDVGFFVETDGRMGIHYDTPGLIAIGDRFVDVWQAIPTPGTGAVAILGGLLAARRRR